MRVTKKSLLGLTLAVLLLACPTLTLAQEATGTAAEGAVAGEMEGRARTSGALWFGAGCIIGPLAVLGAYLLLPNPPATQLLGKSPEYVAAYSDAYRQGAKSVQTRNTWTGCCIGTLASVALNVLLALAANN